MRGTRSRTALLFLVALAVTLTLQWPATTEAQRRLSDREIRWNVEPLTCMLYTVTVARDEQPAFEAEPVADAARYRGRQRSHDWPIFGYQMNDNGPLFCQADAQTTYQFRPRTFEEMVDCISFWLPNGRYRPSGRYLYDNIFNLSNPKTVLRVVGRYEVERLERGAPDDAPYILNAEFQVLTVSPDRDNPRAPRESDIIEPVEALLKLQVTYDRQRGEIVRVEQNVRYYFPWTEPETPPGEEPEKNPQSGWWHVTIDRQGSMASADLEDMQPAIGRAIEMGVQNLRGQQGANGQWGYSSHDPGMTALALLALLASGVAKDDPAIVRGFDFLRSTPPTQTYDAGLCCMAWEALGIPDSEWALAQEGQMPDEFERELSEADRAALTQAAEFLLNNRVAEEDPTFLQRMWSYPTPDSPRRYDHSVTQYALLGLYSAMRCGIEVPQDVWMSVLLHHMEGQEDEGPQVYRILQPDGDHRTDPRQSQIPANARGWAYTGLNGSVASSTRPMPDTRATGSMTTAGLTSMIIAHAGLEEHGRIPRDFQQQIDGSIVDGLAWFQLFHDMTWNLYQGSRDSWYYYYLYGIERVGMLSGQEWFGEHRWYPEGAAILCLQQNQNGSWTRQVYDTCFALLFLKRATLPVRVFTPEKTDPRDEDRVRAAQTVVLMEDIGTAADTYASEVSPTGRHPAGEGPPFWYTGQLVATLYQHNLMEVIPENTAPHPDDDEVLVFVDAWGTPLKYRPWRGYTGDRAEAHNPRSYDLWSAGPDREFGPGDANEDGVDDAEDNICNWSRALEEEDEGQPEPTPEERAERVRMRRTLRLFENICTAAETYSHEVHVAGRYPPEDGPPHYYTAGMLEAFDEYYLMEIARDQTAPHPDDVERRVFVDAWGTPFKYRAWRGVRGEHPEAHNPRTFDLWSAGPDRLFGPGDANEDGVDDADDNICNWSRELEEQEEENEQPEPAPERPHNRNHPDE